MLNFNATEINIYIHLRQWGTATPQQAASRLSQQFFGALCWHSVCAVILWPTFPQTWVWGNTPQPGEVLIFLRQRIPELGNPFAKAQSAFVTFSQVNQSKCQSKPMKGEMNGCDMRPSVSPSWNSSGRINRRSDVWFAAGRTVRGNGSFLQGEVGVVFAEGDTTLS